MKKIIFVFLSILSVFNYANAKDFFLNITDQIAENEFRLSYGVSVTDVNKDNKYDFVVTGFGFKNLALSYKDGKLINIVNEKIFTDEERRTIGVAACDIDQDGYEEIYFLNTDTYSGSKIYSDRLIDLNNNKFEDLFEKEINQNELFGYYEELFLSPSPCMTCQLPLVFVMNQKDYFEYLEPLTKGLPVRAWWYLDIDHKKLTENIRTNYLRKIKLKL